MTVANTYNTGRPLGSSDPRDAFDNMSNADEFTNSTAPRFTDRLGVSRRTITGITQAVVNYVNRGEWTTATAYNVNDIWRDGPTGAFYLVLADYTSGASSAADIASGNVTVQQPKDWVVSVNTISDLRALEPAFDGQQVELPGHTVAGIGGGMFYADYGSSAVDDNGVTVVTTGGRRWIRRTSGYLTPEMFGAAADGVTNDVSAVASMFAMFDKGFSVFDFERKDYYFGTISTHDAAIFEFDKKNDITIKGKPHAIVTTAFATQDIRTTSIFRFIDCSNLHVECAADGSDGFDMDALQPSGVIAVELYSDTLDAENAFIDAEVYKGVAAIQSMATTWLSRARLPSDPYYRNIRYKARAGSAKYGVRFIRCGDGVQGEVISDKVTRSYFVTGVSGHYANIVSTRQRGITDVLIKAYRDNVSDITVDFVQIGSTSTEEAFAIEHENASDDTVIKNITINYNGTRNSGSGVGLLGSLDIANAQYRAATNCKSENIEINCNGVGVNGSSAILNIRSKPNTPAAIRFNRVGLSVVGGDTKNYTLQRGSVFNASARGANPSCHVVFDMAEGSGFSAIVNVYATDDVSEFASVNQTSAVFHVVGYKLSGGSGVILSATPISTIPSGVTPPAISFSVAGGALICSSDSASVNSAIIVSAQMVGNNVI